MLRTATLFSKLPQQCLLCRSWPSPSAICPNCQCAISPKQTPQLRPRCSTCAQLLPPGVPEQHTQCATCLRFAPPLHSCHAAFDYAWPWRGLIADWKFHQQPALAKVLAQQMDQALHSCGSVQQVLSHCTSLVPIAPSAQRLRTRGFHHTLLLAQALQRHCSLPTLWPRALLRLPEREEMAQAQLHKRAERLAHMRGAFVVPPQAVAHLQGQSVLLLDDVMTTGATLYSAADALLRAGAAQVHGLVLARTP